MTAARALLAVLLLAPLAGCGGGSGGAGGPEQSGPPATGPAPPLTAELRQFRADIVLNRAEVTVRARVPLTVQSVQVRAPGFTTADPVQQGVAFPAGGVIDLPVALGAVQCNTPVGAGTALLQTTDAGGVAQTLEVPLSDDGLLGRLYTTGCADLALSTGFSVTLSPTLTPVQVAGRPGLRGTLQVRRGSSTQRLLITEPGGNVIFDVTTDRNPVLDLAPDQQSADALVTLVPARCDAHALTESKRTSLLGFYLSLGDEQPRLHTVEPDPATRAAIERFATDGCQALGPG